MNKRYHLIAIFLITALSLLIYLNSLKNGFVYDDEMVILDASIIKDWGYLPLILTEDYFYRSGEATYRPVVTLSYFFDHLIWGLNPFGYHLTNLLLHIINGILLYIFLIHLYSNSLQPSAMSFRPKGETFSLKLSLLSSLLFVSHPVLTEDVNFIGQREDLLVFMFYTTSLILYIKSRIYIKRNFLSRLWLYLSFISYFFALLSKEMAITLPLILITYSFIVRRESLKDITAILCGYITVTAVYIYIRFYYFPDYYNPEAFPILNGNFLERLIALPKTILYYITLLLFPINLCIEHTLKFTTSITPETIIAISVIFIILYIAIKTDKILLSFGILWFFIALIPVMNLVPVPSPVAEKYLYLPSAGFYMATGSIVYFFLNYRDLWLSKVLFTRGVIISAIIAIIILNSVLAIKRNPVWFNSYALWKDAVKKSPNKRVYNNLGRAYIEKGLYDQAIVELNNALRIDRNFIYAHNNMGAIYMRKGLLDDAVKSFNRIINIDPEYAPAYINLGTVYDKKGLLEEALASFEKARKIDSKYAKYTLIWKMKLNKEHETNTNH